MYGEVIETTQLTPTMWRVVLGGDGLADYEPSPFADSYVNCFFVPAGATYEVPFETDAVRDLPREQRPFPRRYTVRSWNEGRLTLDFVAHGDVGHAGRWAMSARPGDRLQMRGPGGDYNPHADADAYLFVGDESALPAIAVSCERVPQGRPVTVVAVVDDASCELPLTSPGELTVVWLHRAGVDAEQAEGLLAAAVGRLPVQDGVVDAFVHGEAMETRLARRAVLARGVSEEHLSCSPYWRRGLDDEQWRSVKKDFVKETQSETV